MTDKWYDENGYDEEGFDRSGVNQYGEISAQKGEMNLEKEDILASCKTEAGRRFLWRILSFCEVFGEFEPLQSDKADQKQMGRRSVGLYIIGILQEADKDLFLKMLNENHNREKEKEYARTKYR